MACPTWWRRLAAIACVVLCALPPLTVAEYRTFDGQNNNVNNPTWGMGGEVLDRSSGLTNFNGSTGIETHVPARTVSNVLFTTLHNEENRFDASVLGVAWGQFVFDDLLYLDDTGGEAVTLPTLPDDTRMPSPLVAQRLSPVNDEHGVRSTPSATSSYLDGSVLYGNSSARASLMRTLSDGTLYSDSVTGLALESKAGLSNSMHRYRVSTSPQFLSGDPRANAGPGLTSLHGLFALEHNRWASIMANIQPEYDDETVFQEARRRVIAEIQAITYQEFIPSVIGSPLPAYTGYNASIHVQPDLFFAAVGSRFINSITPSLLGRYDADGTANIRGPILLRDSSGSTSWAAGGIAPVLMGMSMQRQMAADIAFVDDVRNYGLGSVPDLAALDIFRGRDLGVMSYTEARAWYGLSVPSSFADVSPNSAVQVKLQQLYANVSQIDALVGALCEAPVDNGVVGPLFAASLTRHFVRVRDGDRFWFENNQFGAADLAVLRTLRFSDVVKRVFPTLSRFPSPAFYAATSRLVGSGADLVVSNGTSVGPTDASGSVGLDARLSFSWEVSGDVFTGSLVYKRPHICSGAVWLAFGLGASMIDADVVMCQWLGGTATCSDRTVTDYAVPTLDTVLGGSEDVSIIRSDCTSSDLTLVFTRPVGASDSRDVSIRPEPTVRAAAWLSH